MTNPDRVQPVGPLGHFEYVINGPSTTPLGPWSGVEFIVTRTGGFLSTLDVFEVNDAGWWAAVNFGDVRNPTEIDNYFAGNSIRPEQPTPVPEPASVLLLGTGPVAASRARKRQLV